MLTHCYNVLTHMNTISLRQFQLKAKYFLDKLPLTLTVYGKPVAIVNTFVNTFKESVNTMSDNLNGGGITEKNLVNNKENRWCQLHFEKGVQYDCKLITWEDENGNAVIKEKWACPKCIEMYEAKGVGRVYFS